MTITVIGHGYVGLVTAVVFADFGNTVWCVGRTKEKIENLKKGISPFYEPGLEELVKKNVDAGRLKFTMDYKEAVPPADVIFICVGTPPKDSGEADLSSVWVAAEKIGQNLKGYTVVSTKSTVPVGTNREVAKILEKEKDPKAAFDIASCPEFLKEGTALSDTLHPDRIVIGVEESKAKKVLLDLHKPIDGCAVVTTIETAEMIKYAANSLLSVKISFANAMAFLCEKVGADVEQVMDGVGLDKRLGRAFLSPGVGYGGSCFPKDVKALIAIAAKYGYDFALLKTVDAINKEAKIKFLEKIEKAFNDKLEGVTIGILGLAFKPNTDDMREAPSIEIIRGLQKKGAKVRAFDPVANLNSSKIISDIVYCNDSYEVAKGADALVVLTEWNEFKLLDLEKIKGLLKKPLIIDGRNIYDPVKARTMGFTYFGVGRS
ncbi:MAG: UDP-glucose 6-dehydrogenase [Candidatus Gottesmanbacteria bacterium GW2011_GWC2_39_8]|uniref:UDP-glucose 6-dehydrogenase n=1 Tax=Candidatus Gottesmanbacteria bacterium GW2011_GWC2_39_8 TaxID=1618450 RepID=A0A0G0T8Z0_9BACT|nr:MAG: UDP-glucose 6-dehydrogenase [Candidatus Gottesmanbacteria bacterium GW2011_GWC2_39_8]